MGIKTQKCFADYNFFIFNPNHHGQGSKMALTFSGA